MKHFHVRAKCAEGLLAKKGDRASNMGEDSVPTASRGVFFWKIMENDMNVPCLVS